MGRGMAAALPRKRPKASSGSAWPVAIAKAASLAAWPRERWSSNQASPAKCRLRSWSWTDLAERAKRLFGAGLGERNENLELVLLAPKTWGPSFYDTLRQELVRPVADDAGRTVSLWLPFTPENEAGVEFLEHHDPAATFGLLGAVRLSRGPSMHPADFAVR